MLTLIPRVRPCACQVFLLASVSWFFSPVLCCPLRKEATTHTTLQERGRALPPGCWRPINLSGFFFMGDLSLVPSLFICSIISVIVVVSWIFIPTVGYSPIILYLFNHSDRSSVDHLPCRLDAAPSLWLPAIAVAFVIALPCGAVRCPEFTWCIPGQNKPLLQGALGPSMGERQCRPSSGLGTRLAAGVAASRPCQPTPGDRCVWTCAYTRTCEPSCRPPPAPVESSACVLTSPTESRWPRPFQPPPRASSSHSEKAALGAAGRGGGLSFPVSKTRGLGEETVHQGGYPRTPSSSKHR